LFNASLQFDGRLWTKLTFFFFLHNSHEIKLVIVKYCQRLLKIIKDCQRLPKIVKDQKYVTEESQVLSTIFNNLAESSTIFHLQFGFGSIYNLRSLAILHFVGLYVSYMRKFKTE